VPRRKKNVANMHEPLFLNSDISTTQPAKKILQQDSRIATIMKYLKQFIARLSN